MANLKVDVAIVDGNLSPHDISGADDRDIIKAIRQHAPNVKVVGLSSSGHVEGSDIDLRVQNVRELGKLVTKL